MNKVCTICGIELKSARVCPKCGYAETINISNVSASTNKIQTNDRAVDIDEEYEFTKKRGFMRIWVVDSTLISLKHNLMKIKTDRYRMFLLGKTKSETTVDIKNIDSIVVNKAINKSIAISIAITLILVAIVSIAGEGSWRILLALAYVAYLYSSIYAYEMNIYINGNSFNIPYEAEEKNTVETMAKSIHALNNDIVVRMDA